MKIDDHFVTTFTINGVNVIVDCTRTEANFFTAIVPCRSLLSIDEQGKARSDLEAYYPPCFRI